MKNSIVRFVTLLLFFFLTACFDHSGQRIILLDYQDFGPQVIANEVIGMEWWQWQDHGDSDPTVRYDITVAVYRNVPLAEVKAKYSVEPGLEKDVRYLEYQKALGFLDEKIAENVMKSVTERLQATRKKITAELGD